jgi:hypothetical protein
MAESPFTGISTTNAAALQAQADQAARIAKDLATQAAAARRAELEASRPQQPPVEAGLPEFVMFSRYQSGKVYTYAAIGWVEGRGRTQVTRWAVTGEETRRFNWAGLLAFIGEANWGTLHQFTDTRALAAPGGEPAVAERMGRYGRVVGTDAVTDTSQAQQGW